MKRQEALHEVSEREEVFKQAQTRRACWCVLRQLNERPPFTHFFGACFRHFLSSFSPVLQPCPEAANA